MIADAYMQDRREADRTRVTWHARVRIAGTPSVSAIIRNISVSGMYLETAAQYKLGATLQLAVRMPVYQDVRVIVFTATVVRHLFLADMRGHGYGVQIAAIDDADRIVYEERLADMLRV